MNLLGPHEPMDLTKWRTLVERACDSMYGTQQRLGLIYVLLRTRPTKLPLRERDDVQRRFAASLQECADYLSRHWE